MKRTNLTQKEFDTIHRLLGLQVPVSTAARIVGKSTSVLYYVRRFPNMETYLAEGRKRVRASKEKTALKKRHPLLQVHNPQLPMVEPMRMQTNVDPSPFMSIGDEVREIHAKVKKLLDLMTP